MSTTKRTSKSKAAAPADPGPTPPKKHATPPAATPPPSARKPAKKATTKAAAKRAPRKKASLATDGIPRQEKGITAEQYNQLWAIYLETQNAEECRRRTGLARSTVARYITGRASPERGMEPIAARYQRVMSQVREDEDMTLIQWRRETFSQTIARLMRILRGDMMIHQAHLKERLDRQNTGHKVPTMMRLDRLIKAMDIVYRMGEHALGGPDQVIGRGEEPFEQYTDEELLELWETGRQPDSDTEAR